MKTLGLVLVVILTIGLTPPVFAESTETYLFKTEVPIRLAFDETLRVLESYDFQVIKLERWRNYIETDYALVKRTFGPRFKVKYKVQFYHVRYFHFDSKGSIKLLKLEMKVISQVREHEQTDRVKRDEMKSARWLIKKVIKRVGK